MNNYFTKPAKNGTKKDARPASSKSVSGRTPSGIDKQPLGSMALGRFNFICMALAGVMIIVGFLLMLGPASTPDRFEPDIFSTRRIVVGPLIAFLGFVAMAIAIIAVPPRNKNSRTETES